MDLNDFVIFAELHRENFDEILQTLKNHFEPIESGRQGDDWIWLHLADGKIEIDSFYSMELEVKGQAQHQAFVTQILEKLDERWMLQIFDPPKIDLTR